MKDEGYLNARRAAAYVGYEPGVDDQGRPLPSHRDRAMRAFYEWVRRHRVAFKRRGRRLVFRKAALDRALDRRTEEVRQQQEEVRQQQERDKFERMAALAREHARDLTTH